MAAEKILVVDDEQSMTQFLGIVLRKEGYQVTTVNSGREALDRVKAENFDVVISDIKMPGMDGIQVLQGIKKHDVNIPVVLMTAYASQQSAIDAVNLGAFQYLLKNAKNDEIKLVVRNALEMRKVRTENQFLKRELKRGHEEKAIIGSSEEMTRVFRMVDKVADSEATILIQGDSGTGKELIAREIHYRSRRANGPFVSINCGAIPRDLLESNLFGHIKGSFTGAVKDSPGLFQVAEGGTFFLDEVGEMPLATQVKLLRALQEKQIRPVGHNREVPVDVRIIAATNQDLSQLVGEGRFREDFYYRINVIHLEVPLLRERREDIPELARHFVERACSRLDVPIKQLHRDAMAVLESYAWPGNVRELENVMERIVAMEPSRLITVSVLPPSILGANALGGPSALSMTLPEGGLDLEAHVDAIRRELMRQALERCAGVQKDAARELHMTYRAFRYHAEKYKLIMEE